MNNNRYCVIMAGGVGSRFWPKSTEVNPKQFLDVLGVGRTLIQMTYDRFSNLIPDENFLVVTNSQYVDLVKEQLPQITASNVLSEPMMRNTAPCIAYAVKKIEAQNPNAVMVVTPADHLITKQEVFSRTIDRGLNYVESNEKILTIGIKPHRPNTGYGYIEYIEEGEGLDDPKVPFPVSAFKEKPDLVTAKSYIVQGNYSWNSGMFMWNLDTIKRSFDTLAPEVMAPFNSRPGIYNTPDEQDFINEIYPSCVSISVDYAILEKADNVEVFNRELGWSDIGTWVSLEEHLPIDEQGNGIISGKTLLTDSERNLISVPEDKIVVAKGMKDMIVVEQGNVLMIVSKDNEQAIKALRSDAGEKFGKDIM